MSKQIKKQTKNYMSGLFNALLFEHVDMPCGFLSSSEKQMENLLSGNEVKVAVKAEHVRNNGKEHFAQRWVDVHEEFAP